MRLWWLWTYLLAGWALVAYFFCSFRGDGRRIPWWRDREVPVFVALVTLFWPVLLGVWVWRTWRRG